MEVLKMKTKMFKLWSKLKEFTEVKTLQEGNK